MQIEIPGRIAQASPDPARIAAIRGRFSEGAAPVRPLPSNGAIVTRLVCAILPLVVVCTVPVSFAGFPKMTGLERLAEGGCYLLLAFLLAGTVAEQMVPGARRILRPGVAVLLAVVLLSLTAALLFPDFSTGGFLRRGIPCLRLGMLCAVPTAALVAVAMRRGFVVEPVAAATAGGALAGLVGIGVLTLHCPIFNGAHIVTFHVGVIALTSLVGALLAWAWCRITA